MKRNGNHSIETAAIAGAIAGARRLALVMLIAGAGASLAGLAGCTKLNPPSYQCDAEAVSPTGVQTPLGGRSEVANSQAEAVTACKNSAAVIPDGDTVVCTCTAISTGVTSPTAR